MPKHPTTASQPNTNSYKTLTGADLDSVANGSLLICDWPSDEVSHGAVTVQTRR